MLDRVDISAFFMVVAGAIGSFIPILFGVPQDILVPAIGGAAIGIAIVPGTDKLASLLAFAGSLFVTTWLAMDISKLIVSISPPAVALTTAILVTMLRGLLIWFVPEAAKVAAEGMLKFLRQLPTILRERFKK